MMNIDEIRKNKPDGATHYIKKTFQRHRYLYCDNGFYYFMKEDNKLSGICREWLFWIKPLY